MELRALLPIVGVLVLLGLASPAPVLVAACAERNAGASMAALRSWAVQHGANITSLRIEQVGQRDPQGLHRWGLTLERSVAQGELVMSIPNGLTITSSAVNPALGAAAVDMPPIVRLALLLLYEQSLGERSFWHLYVSTLPCNVSTPLALEPEELAFLRGTTAEQTAQVCYMPGARKEHAV
jgi:histone-lysine N-methyltransferase SETD3